jgi:hypothetical protein
MSKRSFHSDAVFVMGLYNVAMGAVFFFLYKQIFDLFGIGSYLPAHAPTIQIPCLFLVVFGIGYLAASHSLARNHALLFVGLLQNAAVAGIAIWYKLEQPGLVHNVYLLPAGISALFAIMFLVAWIGAVVESARQRRRRKPTPVRRAPAPAEAAIAVPAAREPEAPPEAPEPEPAEETEAEAAEEAPEPRQPETPSEPEEEPPIHPLAHRDRSGIPPE